MLPSHGGNLHDERLREDSDPEEEELQTSISVSASQQRGRGRAPQQGLQQQASFSIPATGVTDGASSAVQPTSQDVMGREERPGVTQGFPPGPSLIQRPTRRSSRWAQKATV